MDVERTMQFIMANLGTVTAAQRQAENRAARTDRQIRGLQTLLTIGVRRLARLEQRTHARFAELANRMAELAAAQKRTDKKFERWLDSLKGSKGRRKGK
jgi:hypothetical protein